MVNRQDQGLFLPLHFLLKQVGASILPKNIPANSAECRLGRDFQEAVAGAAGAVEKPA